MGDILRSLQEGGNMDDISLAYFMVYDFYQYVNERQRVALSNVDSKSVHLVTLSKNKQ